MSFCSVTKTLLALIAIATLLGVSDAGPSRITLDPDGGYTGIVVKISDEVNDEHCTEIIENFQVRTPFLKKNTFEMSKAGTEDAMRTCRIRTRRTDELVEFRTQ